MPRPIYLRAIRESRMLSQDDVAQRSGVARSTISHLEAGERPARYGTIRKLARALRVKPLELVAGPERDG